MVGAEAQEQRHADVYEQRAHFCGEGDDDERADDGEEPCRIAMAEVVPATHGRPQEDEQEQCERQADEEEGGEARREGEAFRRHGAACAEPGQDSGRRTHDERGKNNRCEHAADEVEEEELLPHAPFRGEPFFEEALQEAAAPGRWCGSLLQIGGHFAALLLVREQFLQELGSALARALFAPAWPRFFRLLLGLCLSWRGDVCRVEVFRIERSVCIVGFAAAFRGELLGFFVGAQHFFERFFARKALAPQTRQDAFRIFRCLVFSCHRPCLSLVFLVARHFFHMRS